MHAIRIFSLVARRWRSCARAAWADAPKRPVVVELVHLGGMLVLSAGRCAAHRTGDKRHDVLPLAFHVTYWNSLGWTDPFSLDAATRRQQGYARISNAGGIYTPQMVIDGTKDVVGSQRDDVIHAIGVAGSHDAGAIPVSAVAHWRCGGDQDRARRGCGKGVAGRL